MAELIWFDVNYFASIIQIQVKNITDHDIFPNSFHSDRGIYYYHVLPTTHALLYICSAPLQNRIHGLKGSEM